MKQHLPLAKEERLYDTVQKGVQLLTDQLEYKQSNLINKLKTLRRAISPASLSNIIHGKKAGLQVLKTAAAGIEAIVRQELGLEYAREAGAFAPLNDPEWEAYIVPEEPDDAGREAGLSLHLEGRLGIQQKTAFLDGAQKEVIEVGIRMKTFADYFYSRRESEFKTHIVSLLQRGVTFKGYLLDPESNEARLYFDDRTRVQETEADAIAEMKKVVEKLRRLVREFEPLHYPGAFEIYLYKHIPYNHFLAVDAQWEGAKMMVSHYLYGVRRAECPVWEFSKSGQPDLFRKYAESLAFYVRDAKRVV